MRRAWVTVIGGLLAGALFGLTSLAVIEAARDVSGKITAAGSWVACFTMSAANVPLTVSLDGGPSVPALGVTWDGSVAHLSLTQQSPAPLAPGLHSWMVSDGTIATTLTYEVIDEAPRPPSNARWFSTAIITRVPMSLPTTNLTLRIDASDNDFLFSNFPGTTPLTDGQTCREWQMDTDVTGVTSFQPPTVVAEEGTWKATKFGSLMFLPAMQFDGVDDVMNTWDKATSAVRESASLFITDSAFTLAGIFHADSINNTDAVNLEQNDFLFGVAGLYAGVTLADASGVKKIRAVVYDGAYKYAEQTILADHTYIFVMRFTGGQIKLTVIDDHGIETASADVASGNIDANWSAFMHQMNIGRASDTTLGLFTGKIGELVAYNADVSGTDLDDLKAYFKAKWLPTLGVYYKTITIDHLQVVSNQTDFDVALVMGQFFDAPLLASDPDLRTVQYGGYVRDDNGYDLRPYLDAAGLQPIVGFERVFYDGKLARFEIHFKAASLSSSVDPVFYLQLGDPSLTTDGSSSTTWDSHYKAVYHGGSETAVSVNDSTSNANHGTAHNLNDDLAHFAGDFGLDNFSASPTRYMSTAVNHNNAAGTWEAWVWVSAASFGADVNGGGNRYLLHQSDAGDKEIALHALDALGTHMLQFHGYNGGYVWQLNTGLLALGVYHHIVGTYDGTDAKLYVNGVLVDSGAGGSVGTATDFLYVGQTDIAALADTHRGHGGIDEVRISDIVRSADWIATQYNNQKAGSTFITLGALTPVPPAAAAPAAIIFRNVNYE